MPPGCCSTFARRMVGRWMTAACAGPAGCDAASAHCPSLLPGWGSTCGVIRLMGSGAARRHHDSYGFHPSSCRSGNREGLWTQRHDMVEDMLMYVMQWLRQSPIRVSRGARNWFGAAAMRPDGSFRRADVVLRGYYGQGRHLFLDVAVADPAGQAPMQAAPSSCASSGVAAELRALHACYICKARFRTLHHFYAKLCPPCAALNHAKRVQQSDLAGRVFLVTGARVKIGFQAALKLLRCGARVLATTRFPVDAAARFAALPDFDRWSANLQIFGLDLRDLEGAAQRFGAGAFIPILPGIGSDTPSAMREGLATLPDSTVRGGLGGWAC